MSSLISQYSKEELECIVKNSLSYAEVLTKLGYSTVNGENSKTLKKRLELYQISTAHFTSAYKRNKWTDKDIFCTNSPVSQSKLRRRFKELNIVKYQCAECGLLPYWNNKPLTLTLDHINGFNKDNRIENLRWICPNCDRQSDTFGTRNKRALAKGKIIRANKYMPVIKEENIEPTTNIIAEYCISCGKKISGYSLLCIKCAAYKNRKVDRPSKEDLFNIIQTNKGNFVAVGKMFGVTDNTIRKWCVGYGLPSHTSDYREKTQPKTKQPRTPPIPIKQIDKSTNETIAQFASIREAQSITLIEHIGDVVNGKRKSAGGYYWVKID